MNNAITHSMHDSVPDISKFQIGSQFLAALKERNWDLLRSIITDDVTWTLPGNSIISGKVSGADAVIKRAKTIVGFGVSLQLNHILIALNGVALSLHNQASRNGLELDEYLMTICTLRGEKISAINTCLSDVPGVNAFFTLKNMDFRDEKEIPAPRVILTGEQEEKFTVATAFVNSLKNNDWHSMHSLMYDDVSWTLPGISTLSGPAYGADAVIKRAQSLKQFGVMFQLMHILYGTEGFTLSLHNTANRNGLVLDEYVAIVFELKDGKIQSMTTHLSDVEGINNFFIKGIID